MKSKSSPCYHCKYAKIIELYETVFFCEHKEEYEDAAKVKQCNRYDLERMYNRDESV